MSDSFNHCVLDGYLKRDADEAMTRLSDTVLEFLLWQVCDGQEQWLRMRVRQAALVDQYKPLLTAGRAVIVHCRVIKVPVMKGNSIVREETAFEVLDAKFPNRARAEVPEEDEAEKQTESAA